MIDGKGVEEVEVIDQLLRVVDHRRLGVEQPAGKKKERNRFVVRVRVAMHTQIKM